MGAGSCRQVVIAMATFNGEKWLGEQISSIREQSFTDWTLLVSDDGSDDSTVNLILEAQSSDSRIKLLPRREGEPGHVANFEYLMVHAIEQGAESIFLADQDDLWQPEKLQLMLGLAMGFDSAALVIFSDMEIISAQGKPMGSYLHSISMHGRYDIVSLLRQNSIAGCSLMVNRNLLELALPFPADLQNHDWWLGLCAVASGELKFSPEKLVRYRQHAENTIGSRNYSMQVRRIASILTRQRRVFCAKVSASEELVRRMTQEKRVIPDDLLCFVDEFGDERGWRRFWRLCFSQFRPRSMPLYLVQLLALMPQGRR